MKQNLAYTSDIVSEAQRRLFGAVVSGNATKATGLSPGKAREDLHASAGKNLPEYKDSVPSWENLINSQR